MTSGGYLWDIREFSRCNGAGIRKTVLFKGCPLHCLWCHDPEGMKLRPELYVSVNRCTHCGLCEKPCQHPDCQPYGRCLHICPENLVRVVGWYTETDELLKQLAPKDSFFPFAVTLSGGEPLYQPDFAEAVAAGLKERGADVVMETCGFAALPDFLRVAELCDQVIMDIKLIDPTIHRYYTGVDNASILHNLEALRQKDLPRLFRVALIPGITDTEDNLQAISALIEDDPIEILPYNPLAGLKYPGLSRTYRVEETATPMTMDKARGFFKNPI